MNINIKALPSKEKFQEVVNDTVSKIEYKNWRIVVGLDRGNTVFLMARFQDDINQKWTTRKWLLSEHMTVSEIVQTAFKMILTAEEHEVREKFKYKNQAIFGPYFTSMWNV